jgi:hypothetical protein
MDKTPAQIYASLNKTSTRLHTALDLEQFKQTVFDIMKKEGFQATNYKGLPSWSRGSSFISIGQYLHFTYDQGWVSIDAWLVDPTRFREIPLAGLPNLPKLKLRKTIQRLEAALSDSAES